MRRPILTLVLLSGLTFFLGLGRQAITDADEGFYAEAAREMVETRDWLTPHFNYDDRWQKPVLYYWLTAATYAIAAPTEGAARFWSAMAGLGLVLLTFAAARRLTGQEDAAWLAGAIVATCFGYLAMARAALPDLPLAFCVTAGIWAALRNRWALAGLAAGLGFLMKGPVALVVPALVLLPIWWRERRTTHLRPRDLGLAALVFAAVGLPWYVAMTMEHGRPYLQSFFISDNFERFATDRFNDPRPIWFYLPIVIGGLLPWSGYLLVLPWRGVADVLKHRRRLTDTEWRLILWVAVPLVFFTLSIGKQPRYILPVLPPMAILIGRSIADRIRSAAPRDLAVATWSTAALYVVLAALLWRARPLFLTVAPAMTSAAAAAIVASGLALAFVAATRRWRALPMTMAASAVVLLLSVQFGALAGIRPEPVERMAALVLANRPFGDPVGSYRVFVRNLVFYARFRQVELFDEARAVEFLKSPYRVLLVVGAADLPRLESLTGVKTTTIGSVDYLDTASIRLGTLLWPNPAEDVERVLLVTNR